MANNPYAAVYVLIKGEGRADITILRTQVKNECSVANDLVLDEFASNLFQLLNQTQSDQFLGAYKKNLTDCLRISSILFVSHEQTPAFTNLLTEGN